MRVKLLYRKRTKKRAIIMYSAGHAVDLQTEHEIAHLHTKRGSDHENCLCYIIAWLYL